MNSNCFLKRFLYNMLSSCYCFNEYFFVQRGAEIAVENFYDTTSKKTLQTYKKLY